MDDTSRESRINSAFVAAADTLTTDFDVVDLLHTLVAHCTEILDADAGGLMLVDAQGHLQLMTSTSEQADFVEVMQLAADSGPCIECFKTGTAVTVTDIATMGEDWPEFSSAAIENGFHAAHATPLRLRGQIIGTMNLFRTEPGAIGERDAAVAQALADVATISILQERVAREGTILAEQLHHALDSRIVVEQAKGMIAHSLSVDMADTFEIMRSYARSRNITIRAVAESISNRTLAVKQLVTAD